MTGKEPEGREELEKGTNRNGKYDFKIHETAKIDFACLYLIFSSVYN